MVARVCDCHHRTVVLREGLVQVDKAKDLHLVLSADEELVLAHQRHVDHGRGELGTVDGFEGVEAPHLHCTIQCRRQYREAGLVQHDARHRLCVVPNVALEQQLLRHLALLPHLHFRVAGACDDQVSAFVPLGVRGEHDGRDGLLVQILPDPLGLDHDGVLFDPRLLTILVVDVVHVHVGRVEEEQQLQLDFEIEFRDPSLRRFQVFREGEFHLEAFDQDDAILLAPADLIEGQRAPVAV
mmetsp:Transcript_23139/g.38730  ORF Transcript_23139/g.38730 Transcript_23139/m.38730 type:complete len:240 (+) Transcript_23139:367-1086(+)